VSSFQENPIIRTYLSALEWFSLFVGDLSNDVSEDVLANAFNKYPSFQKSRVIRDRLSQKVSNLTLFLSVYSLMSSLG
jgi:RNA recognition motif-containing protein